MNATTVNATTTIEETSLEQLSIQVVASFSSAFALLVFVVIQLLYRSTNRHTRLVTLQRRLRFDVSYRVASNPEEQASLRLLEGGVSAALLRDKILEKPPQHGQRVVPTIFESGRNARQEAKLMLEKLRGALGPSFGASANMPMRVALQCIQGVLDPQLMERFCLIYERILFGVHNADGTYGDVSFDDLKFLHAYFYSTILKEL